MKEPGLAKIARTETISEILLEHESHNASTFPDSTDKSVVLTANATAHQWSAWVEIADSSAVTLSSKFTSYSGHIEAMVVETTDQADTVFMVELAYSANKTIISTHRFLTETKEQPTIQIPRVRAELIPYSETVYYRAMCATAGSKTLNVHFRYFGHCGCPE